MAHQFDVVDSEIVLEAPILAVRRDQVRMPGGKISAREIVEHFGAVAVVAADEDNRLYLLNRRPGSSMSQTKTRWRPPSVS